MAKIRGGEKLERAMKEIAKKISTPMVLQVGFLAEATYPDGKSVAMIAAIQEYGAPSRGILPRPFFRNMIAAKSDEWPGAIANLLIETDYDVVRTLQLTGEAIQGQLQQSIIDTNAPPLKEATVKRKGFNKPLIDTGNMINSAAWQVKLK